MSQHDMDIVDASGALVRADLNLALKALASNSSGSTAPSTTYAFQYWIDTSGANPILKIRNAANNAWITVGQIDLTNMGMIVNPMTAIGQIVYGGASGAPTALAVGTSGQRLKSGGSGAPTWSWLSVTSQTATYTAVLTDEVILCSASSGAFTVNLPTAVGNSGKTFQIKKTDSSANAVTVDGNSTETIDGATTYAISIQYASITIVSDGSNWLII